MRLKPSNPARLARPAMMEETTSGTMIILSAWRKRSPRRSHILRKDWSHGASSNFLSSEPMMTAAMRAMMICQWAAIFFMLASYRYGRGCKKLNFALLFTGGEIDFAA